MADYQSIVGAKTTFRILNNKWVDKYATTHTGEGVWLARMPLEPNVTLVSAQLDSRVWLDVRGSR